MNSPKKSEQERALMEAVDHLMSTLSATPYADKEYLLDQEDMAMENLKGFSSHTLRRLPEIPWEPQEVNEFLYILESAMWIRDEFAFNDYLSIAKDFPAASVVPHDMIKGLSRYRGICPQDQNCEYPEERRAQVNALLRITHHLRTKLKVDLMEVVDGSHQYYIKDEKLSSLIINPGEGYSSSEIADFIITRNITDADTIKELLSGTVPAISDGVL